MELALEALLAGAHHVVEVAPLVMEGVVVDPRGWVGVVADYHERGGGGGGPPLDGGGGGTPRDGGAGGPLAGGGGGGPVLKLRTKTR